MVRILILALVVLRGAWPQMPQYDLLIRNARVIDGTGNAWFRGDVAIANGRIAAVGRLNEAKAARTINAAGRVLAPGFIDVHTHIEQGIEKVPRADNYLLDGVTSVVTGNCGGSETDLAAWFRQLESTGIGINIASLIGHNAVRSAVIGTAQREATPEEMDRMQSLVDQAMRDGAVGFSTGLIYVPGTYANTDEVIALARAAAKHGGVYASHIRNEGPRVMEAITEAATVGRDTGLPVQISHFKIDTKSLWGMSEKTVALIEEFRREGVDVVVDQYPYERSSTTLSTTLPSWALADGNKAIVERLSSPETRARIIAEMLDGLKRKGQQDYSYATVATFRPDTTLEGRTISEINVLKGRPRTPEAEAETILDLILAMDGGRVQMVYHTMGDADIDRILRYPHTAIASDGGVREFGLGVPHPRSYGTNARVLAEYVRRRRVITLEDAIRRMTSLPARTFGFRERGLVREGFAADLVLFDPARVEDKATYAKPHAYSEGFDWVFVNGVPVVEDDTPNAALPGRIIRRGGP
ncbi:MAG TPA: D-aminoacylase [Bryobacteraceae bacterium]|nr:D-aminoacylase [Bryobacteraceae bacterium]